MKIEMGESLIASWLKHIQKCQLVQMNWKVSPEWEFTNKDILRTLMEKSNALFSEKYGYEIYKKNSFEQLIAQSEVDVIGISFEDNGSRIYAVDIAFHEAGLNYGSRRETTEIVVKKYLRTAMCVLGCFNLPYGDIVFASPKINPAVCADIISALDDVRHILAEVNLEYKVDLLCNERFDEVVLQPVISACKNISDTSELFMRSMQLTKLFDTTKPKKIEVDTSTRKIAESSFVHKDCIPGFEKMKIAEIARTVLANILQSESVSKEEIEKLQTKEYSKVHFDLQYPLLAKVSEFSTRPPRYMAKPLIECYGEKYYLCSEWFEKPDGNNDRPFLLEWIKQHQG